MVEDNLANLKVAKRLGMKTVWVDPAARAPAHVDVSIRSVVQLTGILRRLHTR
jgi:putative hydrolase of the HAD superfamily